MSKRKYRKYEDFHKTINEIEYKQCKNCKEWFPMNSENFRVQPSQKDGYSDMCIICQKEYQTEYYNKTGDKQREQARKYKKENWDSIKIKEAKYVKKNREHVNKRFAEWQKTHPERLEYLEKYRKENKDKISIYNKNRQQKNHRITDKEWDDCKFYFNHRCAYCGLPIEEHFIKRKGKLIWMDLHKEHVIDDGRNDIKNCIPSCQSCNSKKHKNTLNQWYNPNNPNYTYERYHKIYQWLRYDYKKYIHKKKPKQKYTKKVS
jgi:hypothetical protein